MSEYRKDFREAQGDFYWSLPRIFFAVFAALILFGVGGLVFSLLSQPARVISKTFDADNIINNYEWYHDANNQVIARVAQIKGHKGIIADNTDNGEKARLRIELSAIQQSCRDLAGRYNSNATKVNRSIFMGKTAPASLDPSICE